MHEIGQSPYNFEVDQGKVKIVAPESGKTYVTNVGQQTITKKLKKSTWNCHEDNSNLQTNCISNFYSNKLGCTLPWVQEKHDFTQRKCKGEAKFQEFRNLSMSVHEGKMNEEIEKQGEVDILGRHIMKHLITGLYSSKE